MVLKADHEKMKDSQTSSDEKAVMGINPKILFLTINEG